MHQHYKTFQKGLFFRAFQQYWNKWQTTEQNLVCSHVLPWSVSNSPLSNIRASMLPRLSWGGGGLFSPQVFLWHKPLLCHCLPVKNVQTSLHLPWPFCSWDRRQLWWWLFLATGLVAEAETSVCLGRWWLWPFPVILVFLHWQREACSGGDLFSPWPSHDGPSLVVAVISLCSFFVSRQSLPRPSCSVFFGLVSVMNASSI